MFEIDTGGPRSLPMTFDRCTAILDGVTDALPPGATQAQIDAALVSEILGLLREPKKCATVRRRFNQFWPLIQPLAEREPEQFDAIILELAERLTSLG